MKRHDTNTLFLRWALLCLALVLTVGRLNAQVNHLYVKVKNNTNTDIPGFLWIDYYYYDTGSESFVPDEFIVPITLKRLSTSETFHIQAEAGGVAGITYISWRTEFANGDFVGDSYIASEPPSLQEVANGNLEFGWGDHGTSGTAKVVEVNTASRFITPDIAKPMWMLTTETLDAELFREGVDKIIASNSQTSFLLGQAVAESGGGGGGTSENQATYYDQHALLTNQTEATTAANAILDGLGVDVILEAAQTATTAAIPTYTPGTMTEPTGGSADFLTITLPAEFGGVAVNFNPFISGRFDGVATWFRYATQWLVMALLGMWVFKEFQEWLKAYASTNQADGRPLFAGTGGQAAALVNAGLITAAVVVAITALMAWAVGSIDIPTLITNMTVNPLLGFGANAYWFLDQALPLGTILACFLARFSFMFAGNAIFATLFTVIRFCVL